MAGWEAHIVQAASLAEKVVRAEESEHILGGTGHPVLLSAMLKTVPELSICLVPNSYRMLHGAALKT